MLRDGEAQFDAGIYFDRVAGTMENLPFRDGAFDAAFASASVHHASNLKLAFSEIARVLRPGGTAVLVNEPVAGLLKSASAIEQFEEGMNEHLYRVWDYVTAARSASLRPSIRFPDSLAGQLTGRIPAVPGRHWRMARVMWDRLPPVLRRLSLWPAHALIGVALVLVIQKEQA
jgi:SAM-dependent methyltransferase